MVNVNLQDKQQEFCDYYALANPIPNARAKVPASLGGARPKECILVQKSHCITG
jgi:hypothetical protein